MLTMFLKIKSLNCLIKNNFNQLKYTIYSTFNDFFYRGSRLYIFFQSDSRCKKLVYIFYVKIKGKIIHARAINNCIKGLSFFYFCVDQIMKKHNTIMFSEKNIKYSKIVYIQWDSKPWKVYNMQIVFFFYDRTIFSLKYAECHVYRLTWIKKHVENIIYLHLPSRIPSFLMETLI